MTEFKAREFTIQHLEGVILGAAKTKIYKDDIHVIEKSYATRLLKFVEHKGCCPAKEKSDVGCSCGLNEILKELGE